MSHKERVVLELEELSEKYARLSNFILGDIFKTLPKAEQDLLVEQSKVMKEYVYILEERIRLFTLGEK